MSLTDSLTEDLVNCPAVQILKRALNEDRLAHGILLHGESLSALESVCHSMAQAILQTDINILQHPDFFSLRPQGKMRFINVGSKNDRVGGEWPTNSMRRLIHDLHLTPQAGDRKVAVVYEVDRMNNTAANAFLKTLEEPPKGTTIFLLTTRPYKLLATIRSRCLNFSLPSELNRIQDENWQQWLADYTEWLHTLKQGNLDRSTTAEVIMTIYGLLARFSHILNNLTQSSWKAYTDNLPENFDNDQKAALEAGFKKSILAQLFTEIEKQTHSFALKDSNNIPTRAFAQAIQQLEKYVGLLEVNLNELAALEAFLLKSLRFWSAQ